MPQTAYGFAVRSRSRNNHHVTAARPRHWDGFLKLDGRARFDDMRSSLEPFRPPREDEGQSQFSRGFGHAAPDGGAHIRGSLECNEVQFLHEHHGRGVIQNVLQLRSLCEEPLLPVRLRNLSQERAVGHLIVCTLLFHSWY